MPRKPRSVESLIAEHEKYRRQCQIRIKPSLILCGIALGVAAAVLWLTPFPWGCSLAIFGFPVLLTDMEVLGYYSNDRAIKKLKRQVQPPSGP